MTWLGLVLVFLLTLGGTIALRAAGIIDLPNHRSSHVNPTPRGGGVAVIAAFLLGIALFVPDAPADRFTLIAIAVCGLGAGVLGLLDDLFTLSEGLKLVLLTALCLGLAATAGPVTDLGFTLPWVSGLVGSTLFLFTSVNAVNFMDGSDGLMAGSLAVASVGLGLLFGGEMSWVAFAFAVAWAGFAVFNGPVLGARGSLFAGDAGALGGSIIFAGLALYWAAGSEPASAWLAALLLLPFLGDVLLTMASRAKAGRHLFTPHRAHAYQLLIRMGWSHRRVAVVWALLSAIVAGLAVLGDGFGATGKIGMFWLGVAGFTVFHQAVRRKARAAGLDTTQ